MTNYINGVQQVSITIPNGSTSATATITAATGTAFIIFQGFTDTQAGTNPAISQPRVELTNSTTVTAYRNTSDTTTVTVNAVVVDATSSLVKSVQNGSIHVTTAGSGSGTATITSVTTTNTVIAFLGFSSANTNTSPSTIWPKLDLTNATTVTGSAPSAGGDFTVGFCVIEFQGAALNSNIQAVSDSAAPSSSTRTHSITSVTANNTMLVYGGQTNTGTSITGGLQYGTLTNGTTITIGTETAGFVTITYNCFVAEFVSGVLSQNAQRGTISLVAATSGTATITSADTTLTAANFGGNSSTGTTFAGDYGKITQTNATTITGTVNTAVTAHLAWEALTFTGGAAAAGIEYITTPEEDEVFLNQWDEDEPTQMNITAQGSPTNTVEVYSAPEEEEIYDYGRFYGIEEDEPPSHVFPAFGNPVGTEAIFGSPPEEEDIRLDQWDEDEPAQSTPSAPAAVSSLEWFTSPEEDEVRLDQWDEDDLMQQIVFPFSTVDAIQQTPEEDEIRLDAAEEDDPGQQPIFPFSRVDAIQQTPEEDEVRLDTAEEDDPGQQPILAFTTVDVIQESPDENEVPFDMAQEDESSPQPVFQPDVIQASDEDFFDDAIIPDDENTALILVAAATVGVEYLTSNEELEVFDYIAEEDEPSFPAFIGAPVTNTIFYFSPDDLFNYISV